MNFADTLSVRLSVSVPFDAGRGLMHLPNSVQHNSLLRFSTLRCGSWIDAAQRMFGYSRLRRFQYPSMRVVD